MDPLLIDVNRLLIQVQVKRVSSPLCKSDQLVNTVCFNAKVYEPILGLSPTPSLPSFAKHLR